MTSKHRESALLLHGLRQVDRQWILDRLSDDDQRIVGEHLIELASLGVPAEPGLLGAAAEPVGTDGPRDPLNSAGAARMLELLADEPDWLVLQILALDEFVWRDAFLQGLSPARRARLAAHRIEPPKPGFAHCLRTRLNRRLESDSAKSSGTPSRAGLIALLRQGVGRLLSRKHRASAPSRRKGPR